MHRTLLAGVLLLASCAGSRPALRTSPLVGHPIEIVADDLAGREVRLGADPDHVRVLDFWATWCEPCREQLPVLDRLARSLGEQGLTVHAIAFDEDRALLDAFLVETPVSIPILWDKGGARLAERLDIQRLPTTLIVDRRGVVRAVHLGFRSEEVPKLEREVKALLAEPKP